MKYKKYIWNKGKALVLYMHPFKDEVHLRKKLIRWPKWKPDSNLVEVYSEAFGCWFDIDPKRIYKIYDLL